MSVIHEFVSRLDGVRRSGEDFSARCPAHEDHQQSLSVKAGEDGRVLVTCFAGCTIEAITAAIGWSVRDLFPRAAEKGKTRIIATYDYHDESGGLLYQVVRLEPKSFRQRRPDDNGGW